jgi:hypothetical protein
MTMGHAPDQSELGPTSATYCDGKLSPTSIYGLLYRECHNLFPDGVFADLFANIGRDSVPPRIVAVVMVLQRLEGLSDREAVDRFAFDVRWKYAAGGLPLDASTFAHTVLVDMRARLRTSKEPERIFRIVANVARSAGLVGRRRVLDSTPLYDAVATQDTVTMIRASIRGLLRVADEALAKELRGVLKRDDDYGSAGKPTCDWDDKGRPGGARRRARAGRVRGARPSRWARSVEPPRGRGSREAGRHRGRAGPGEDGRRALPDRAQGRQGPGDLDGGP